MSRPPHLHVAEAVCALVDLLTGDVEDLVRLSPQERADALGRGLAVGLVRSLKGSDPLQAVARLRAVARWVSDAADRIERELPVRVESPAEAEEAIATVRSRRAA